MIYIRLENDKVVEIIEPLVLEGKEVPIKQRFSKEFIESLVEISDSSPLPVIGASYLKGLFVEEVHTSPQAFSSEHLRLMAYADPITGSDRYFAEALALQADGYTASSVEVKELKQKGLARKEEIKLAYPKS